MHPRLRTATLELLRSRRALLEGGARHVGWKLAFDFPEVDAVTGGREPALGYLTTATLLADRGRFDCRGARELRAETEVAVEVGAGGRVAGFAVAIELVDVARPPDDLEGIVTGNVAHRGFVLGPSRPRIARGARARVVVDGRLRESSVAAVDAPAAIAAVGGLLAELGESLAPGDRILCGALTHVPVNAGSVVAAAIDALGSVSVAVS